MRAWRNTSLWFRKMENEAKAICQAKLSKSKRFRFLLNLTIATCLIACIASQVSVCLYNYHKFMQLNSRIDNLKQLVEVIAVEKSSKLIASQQAISDENEVMREKRSVAEERFADLRGLAERVMLLEDRYA